MPPIPSRMAVAGRSLALVLLAGAALTACATPQPKYAPWTGQGSMPSGAGGRYKVGEPYQVGGIWYVPKEQPNYDETGTASWYGDQFNNKATANGEIFDMNAISAAHPTLPMPSIVEVTNLDNGRKLQVRVNDRGPYVGGRLIDLSHAAAQELGYANKGLARVRVRYVGPAPLNQMAAKAPSLSAPASTGGVSLPTTSLPPVIPPYAPVVAATAATAAVTAPIAVATSALPPAAPAPGVSAASLPPPPPLSPSSNSSVPINTYRIQAGAFADSAKAARIAAQLGETAEATVEPVTINGTTLYRVLVSGGEMEADAAALREKVAALGYPEARLLKPR